MRAPQTALAALLLAAAACGGPGYDSSGTGSVQLGPNWVSVWSNVIAPKCSPCHLAGGEGVTLGGLDMSSRAVAFAALVNVASPSANAAVTVSPRPLRVVPGDAAASLLYLKVSGTPPAGYGSRMPYLGLPLSAPEVAAVQGWIAAGASDNYGSSPP